MLESLFTKGRVTGVLIWAGISSAVPKQMYGHSSYSKTLPSCPCPRQPPLLDKAAAFRLGMVSPASDFWVVGGFLLCCSPGCRKQEAWELRTELSVVLLASIIPPSLESQVRLERDCFAPLCQWQRSSSVCIRMQVLSHSAALAASRGGRNHGASGELTLLDQLYWWSFGDEQCEGVDKNVR